MNINVVGALVILCLLGIVLLLFGVGAEANP